MYILSELEGKTLLEVRDYSGKLLRNLPLPKGIPSQIRLSPNQQILLIQLRPSGLALLNLDTNELVLGPAEAEGAVWSPDGQKIAYLKPWELWLYHITSKKSSLLASREPTNTYQHCPYFQEPVWSQDGTMLAVNIGGDSLGFREMDAPTLLLSLKEGAVTVFPEYVYNMIWLPNPHALPTVP
jgi:hypothetical protein